MIRDRRRSDTGRYRVGDRYGLWLCKDYIPIVRVNEWITGFGSGTYAFVLLHGFVNCQSLKLTANRGDIANTDPQILDELQRTVKNLIDKVDTDLTSDGLYKLIEWQEEQRTVDQERLEFTRRVKNLKNRRIARYQDHLLFEPQNESELFGLFMMVYSLHPNLFSFEPLDYNTTRGIDVIAKNKSKENNITDGEHWYVELKYTLKTEFNHAFKHIRWIVCWDFDKSVGNGTEFRGVEENDVRHLQSDIDNEQNIYFLDNKKSANKIQVLRFKEFMKVNLGIDFDIKLDSEKTP